jgi:hypothetical protein
LVHAAKVTVPVPMSLLLPLERWLVNLEEDVDPGYLFIYVPKATALKMLKDQTGQDFGEDAKRWRQWLEGAGLIPIMNIPAEMLKILEDDFPPDYVRGLGDREAAVKRLREWTGQDFGFDALRWREWLESGGFVQSKAVQAEQVATADGGRDSSLS